MDCVYYNNFYYYIEKAKGVMRKKADDASEPTLWHQMEVNAVGNCLMKISQKSKSKMFINLKNQGTLILEILPNGNRGAQVLIQKRIGKWVVGIDEIDDDKLALLTSDGFISISQYSMRHRKVMDYNTWKAPGKGFGTTLSVCPKSKYIVVTFRSIQFQATALTVFEYEKESRNLKFLATCDIGGKYSFFHSCRIFGSVGDQEKLIITGLHHGYPSDISTFLFQRDKGSVRELAKLHKTVNDRYAHQLVEHFDDGLGARKVYYLAGYSSRLFRLFYDVVFG